MVGTKPESQEGGRPGLTLRAAVTLAKTAVAAWSDDYVPSMGAALAYYTMFSIAPPKPHAAALKRGRGGLAP